MNETIKHIVAEMRRDCPARHMDGTMYREEDWVYTKGTAKKLADRIEAAWKRESEATTEKSSAVGNAGTVREVAQEMLNTSMQSITAERINGWAVRLAAACEQTVTDCNHLGNAAAMRKALVQVSRIAVEMTRKTITGEPEDRKTVDRWALRLCDIACDAVSAPPRNCDLYTVGEALRKYGFPTKIKPWGEKEWLDFCEWLVSEVEGETKGE